MPLRAQENLGALIRYGVEDTPQARELCWREEVSPVYIHRLAARLRSERKLRPDLLLRLVELGDPPDGPPLHTEENRARYLDWLA